jgi:hypothetical protein
MNAPLNAETVQFLREGADELQKLQDAGMLSESEKRRMLERLWLVHQQDKQANMVRDTRARQALISLSSIGTTILKSTKG